jgi:hypothetical protein
MFAGDRAEEQLGRAGLILHDESTVFGRLRVI